MARPFQRQLSTEPLSVQIAIASSCSNTFSLLGNSFSTSTVQDDGRGVVLRHVQEVQEACPTFAAVGRDTALCTMLSLGLPSLRLTAQSIKLQYNAGTLSTQSVVTCGLLQDVPGSEAMQNASVFNANLCKVGVAFRGVKEKAGSN